MASIIQIDIDNHALIRAQERGTNEQEIRETIFAGEQFLAKRGRTGFRKNFVYKGIWVEKYFENKQLEVFAAKQENGWYVITVITKFF